MICPKCQSEVTDGSAFCTKCGAALGGNNQQNYSQPEGAAPQGDNQNQGNPNPQFNAQGNPQFNAQGNPQFNNQGYQQNYAGNGIPPYGAPYVDPKDHTAEFTPQDISEHKVFAMLPYLLGTIGIIIALLAAKDSKYIMFHVREAYGMRYSCRNRFSASVLDRDRSDGRRRVCNHYSGCQGHLLLPDLLRQGEGSCNCKFIRLFTLNPLK